MIYIAINGDDVGTRIGQAIASDDHQGLESASQSIKQAQDMVQQWVEGNGGKVVTSSGDEGIYAIPESLASELDSIKDQYQQLSGHSLTIGTGQSMSEASKALIYGKLNDKNQIVHYEPSIEDYLSTEDVEDLDEDEEEQNEEVAEDTQADEDDLEEEELPQGDALGEEDLDEADDELPKPQEIKDGEEFDEGDLEEEEAQPEHEKDMSPEENMEHDAAENLEDELDPDNVEADEEQMEEGLNGKTDEEEGSEEDDLSDSIEEDLGDAVEEELQREGLSDVEQGAPPQEEDLEGEESPYDDMAEAPEKPGVASEEMPEDAQQAMPEEMGEETPMEDGMDEEVPEGEEVPMEDGMGEEEYDQDDALSDMIYGHMEHEDSEQPEMEDGDHGDLKVDIADALMAFKNNKEMLEAARDQNPELYQAVIVMLRSMIDMAKKLGFAPEADVADAEAQGVMEDQMPQAGDELAEEQEMPEEMPVEEPPFPKKP